MTTTRIDCGSLAFEAGRRMQVLTTFTYSFSTGNGDPWGDCVTTLDGAVTSVARSFSEEDHSLLSLGGPPVIDVITVDPGIHTLGLECNEGGPDSHDVEYADIRIAAVELAMD